MTTSVFSRHFLFLKFKTAKVVFFAAVEGWVMPEWVRYPTSGVEAQVFAHKYHDTLGKKSAA